MRRMPVPSPSMVVALAALVVSLGGTGFAATRGSGDARSGPVGTAPKALIKALVKTDVAKYFASHRRQFVGPRGPGGPTGPTGPAGRDGSNGAPGSAVAFAHVLADGTLDVSNSKNVTSSYESSHTGQYCLNVAVPFKNVVASGDAAGTASFVGADVSPGDIAFSCTAGPANVLVVVFSAANPAPNPFYIMFN